MFWKRPQAAGLPHNHSSVTPKRCRRSQSTKPKSLPKGISGTRRAPLQVTAWLSAVPLCAGAKAPLGCSWGGGGGEDSPHAGSGLPIWCHALRAEIPTGTSGSICPRRHCARLSSFSTDLASPKAKMPPLWHTPALWGQGWDGPSAPHAALLGVCTEGRGEEEAKVELTRPRLFKSIKGR